MVRDKTYTSVMSVIPSYRSDMPGVCLALCHATEEDVNTTVSARDARTPLHLAAALGHLGIAQMLIWANSNVKVNKNPNLIGRILRGVGGEKNNI